VSHRVVPARPDFLQYRKQAKDLLNSISHHFPESLARMRQHHPRLRELTDFELKATEFKLADAQLVIAREHGFDSWARFSRYLRSLRAEPADAFEARVRVDDGELPIEVSGRREATGLVLFVLAGNVGRHHAGTREIAKALNRASFCTVLADLLTEDEEVEDAIHEVLRYDIRLLANRAAAIVDWVTNDVRFRSLNVGLLGSGTGAAAAGLVALERRSAIRVVACCAGRADLAGAWFARGEVPTLFIAGSEDAVGLGFTRFVARIVPSHVPCQMEIIGGGRDRFDAGPVAARAAELVSAWFAEHLAKQAGDGVRSR